MSFRLGSAAALLAAIACGTTLPLSDLPPEDAGPPDAGDACPATWTTRMDTISPHAVALDPTGRLFVAGADGALAWIAELDPCTGAVLRENRFAPDDRSATSSTLLATESALFVAGDVGGDVLRPAGMVAQLDKDLRVVDAGVIPSTGLTALNRIALGSDGALWLGGGTGIFGGPENQLGWLVRLGDGGCDTHVGQLVTGLAPLDDGRMLVAIQTDAGTTALVRVQGCTSDGTRDLPLPEVGGPNDIERDGEELFVVGAMGGEQNQAQGYVGVGTFDGGWRFAEPIDPTIGNDSMVRVETDGVALFVGGLRNLTFGSGTPTVYRFDRPLDGGAKPVWESQPFGGPLLVVTSLAVAPRGDDAIYVTGYVPVRGGGAIQRCSKQSGCSL